MHSQFQAVRDAAMAIRAGAREVGRAEPSVPMPSGRSVGEATGKMGRYGERGCLSGQLIFLPPNLHRCNHQETVEALT